MKRQASRTDVRSLNSKGDALLCLVPPRCAFSDEEGYARREFSELAGRDQEQVMKDVYGMEEMVDENPTLVKECLFQLEQELTEYAGNDKIALELARKEHTSFFEDEKFRLKFLRTDNYNPKRAARRIVRHLEIKLDLFGPDKLGKKITLEDLSEDDMESLLSGAAQFLPTKDRGGRLVFWSRMKNWKFKDPKNMLRAIWYLVTTKTEDADFRRGVVGISYQNGAFTPGSFDRSVFKSVLDMTKRLPIRLAGYHFCFDDIRYRMVWGLAIVFIGKEARLRARDHEGTHIEVRYGLMSYGISVDWLPVSIEGEEDNTHLLKWVEERRNIERESSSCSRDF